MQARAKNGDRQMRSPFQSLFVPVGVIVILGGVGAAGAAHLFPYRRNPAVILSQ